MMKLKHITLALAVVLVITGCGGGSSDSATPVVSSSSSSTVSSSSSSAVSSSSSSLSSSSSSSSSGINRAFPQHLTYGTDKILPDNYTRAEMDQHVQTFYDYWKQEYVVYSGLDVNEKATYRIAFAHPNEENHNVTSSEGQGFGMVILAQMAGYDPDAKAIFNGLFRFFRQYPSKIDSRLMAWRVPKDLVRPEDSAFDGDSNIAFALLLASEQWGDQGEINYKLEAQTVVDALYDSVVGPLSQLPMLGDWVDPDGATYNQYTNRTSDFMLANFSAFSRVLNDERWDEIYLNLNMELNTQ